MPMTTHTLARMRKKGGVIDGQLGEVPSAKRAPCVTEISYHIW